MKTTKATNWEKGEPLGVKLLRLLFFFIPNPNRKNEKLFYLLNEWYIEFDENGEPYREMGIDKNDVPIFGVLAGEDEYGFWLDTNMKYSDFLDEDSCIIDSDQFYEKWKILRP